MVSIGTSSNRITVDGKKTFLTFVMNNSMNATSMTPDGIKACKDFFLHWNNEPNALSESVSLPIHKAQGTVMTRQAWNGITDSMRNHPNFVGWHQCDEPILNSTTQLGRNTEASCIAESRCGVNAVWTGGKCYYGNQTNTLSAAYQKWKQYNKAVFLNVWHDPELALPLCDIISWDTYTIGKDGWGIVWPRDLGCYAYERNSDRLIFANRSITKPIMAIIQGLGKDFISTPGILYPMTPAEFRNQVYSAICMGVQGIGVWAYYVPRKNPDRVTYYDVGIGSNPILFSYYTQVIRELKSLNDILVAGTTTYSVHGRPSNGVSFSNSYSAQIGTTTIKNWSYILKDTGHLIVVNKDVQPISTTINILGSTQSGTISTIGLEKGGRSLIISNGSFSDTFEGLAVHIYQLNPSPIPPPPPPPSEGSKYNMQLAFGTIIGGIIAQEIFKK